MKLVFQRVVTSWFILAASLSIALAVAGYISVLQSTATVTWVEHTLLVAQTIRKVARQMTEAVVEVRSYHLTGEDRLLASYHRSLAAIDAALSDLRRLTAADPAQHKRLAILASLITRRIKLLEDTLAEKKRGATDPWNRVFQGNYGEELRQGIRDIVSEMEDAEQRFMDLRVRAATSSRRWSLAVLLVGTAVNVAIMALVLRSVLREIGKRGETEQTLRQSQKRFRGVFDASTSGMALVDTSGKWLEVNRSLCRMLGYLREELLGTDCQRLTHPDDIAADRAESLRVLHGEISSYQKEKRYIHKLGHILWITRGVSLVRDDAGHPAHFVILMEDITLRKQAAQALADRTRELENAQTRLSVTAEFVSTLNQEGMLDAYRGALGCLARATDVPLAVIYGAHKGAMPVSQCAVGPDHFPLSAASFSSDGLPATVVRTGEIQTLVGPFEEAKLRIHFGLGEVDLHSVIGWPIVYMGRCLGALITAHTTPPAEERRAFVTASLAQLAIRMNGFQVEEQRLQLVADLQARSDDLQAQSTALEEARQEAERASHAKSEFLANMSHELRTPLNSIMGFTERLITKVGATLPERELKSLLTVERNAKHLLILINDILDLAKIEAGQMELSRYRHDLAALVRDAVEQSASLTDHKPVDVRLELPDGPVMVDGDRLRLKQVVLNLLSNAVRYTDAGTVTISAREVNDDRLGPVVRLAVRDTGIGIKPEDLSRLFQQFTQLDGSSTRKVGGTGLGLAISAHYVRMHGGRIDVVSEFGKGTEFTVLLPVQAPVPRAAPVSTAVATPRSNDVCAKPTGAIHQPDRKNRLSQGRACDGFSILCIDDEPDMLSFLQMTFEDAGYQVMLAGDHDSAIAEARVSRPDLICLDLKMPGKSGFEVLKALRADPELCHIPVVVVSASSEAGRSLECGALHYLAKPVRVIDLMVMVREVLDSSVGSVLIVEDDPDAARLYADLLAEGGLDVRTASNGREGLDRLVESVPSVIVLDLMMPIMDGFTFLEFVQNDAVWCRVPVIILTAMMLSPEEVAHLEGSNAVIMIKGRDATEQVVDSILKTARIRRHAAQGVAAGKPRFTGALGP